MREFYLARALDSVRSLADVLGELTDEELIRAVELEEGSLRRKSVLTLLYRQLRVNARRDHEAKIKEKLNGSR